MQYHRKKTGQVKNSKNMLFVSKHTIWCKKKTYYLRVPIVTLSNFPQPISECEYIIDDESIIIVDNFMIEINKTKSSLTICKQLSKAVEHNYTLTIEIARFWTQQIILALVTSQLQIVLLLKIFFNGSSIQEILVNKTLLQHLKYSLYLLHCIPHNFGFYRTKIEFPCTYNGLALKLFIKLTISFFKSIKHTHILYWFLFVVMCLRNFISLLADTNFQKKKF
ncbi:hypothetical protein AGLY_012876 [Aphis glycines]|uniref:Uncharacterized protein n=1 Tax=Aphis glycines TaxID=307491 RepID=A0A6G0T887_APHGL|nr:hypothetical protein AGLY_012876 [Aphis glycines]